jgi:cytochrome c nitrite reductase small subunit
MRKSLVIGTTVFALFLTALIFGPGAISASGAEPSSCGACHVMEKNVASFQQTTDKHKTELSCSDCHVPHQNAVGGLVDKYRTGIRHVSANMTGNIPDQLRLRPADREVVTANCVRCHADQEHSQQNGLNSCLNCHANVPHGERGELR